MAEKTDIQNVEDINIDIERKSINISSKYSHSNVANSERKDSPIKTLDKEKEVFKNEVTFEHKFENKLVVDYDKIGRETVSSLINYFVKYYYNNKQENPDSEQGAGNLVIPNTEIINFETNENPEFKEASKN